MTVCYSCSHLFELNVYSMLVPLFTCRHCFVNNVYFECSTIKTNLTVSNVINCMKEEKTRDAVVSSPLLRLLRQADS